MKLEDQVITLEQAKRLQELGVTAPSIFSHSIGWVQGSDPDRYLLAYGGFEAEGECDRYPAYTVAELGEMLPFQYLNPASILTASKLNPDEAMVTVWKSGKEWRYRGGPDDACSKQMTEAQARAGLLIHLLENGIVSPPKTSEA